MDSKTRPALLMGYDLHARGKRKGHDFVLDLERLRNSDSIHNCKVVLVKDIVIPKLFTSPAKEHPAIQPEECKPAKKLNHDDDELILGDFGPESDTELKIASR